MHVLPMVSVSRANGVDQVIAVGVSAPLTRVVTTSVTVVPEDVVSQAIDVAAAAIPGVLWNTRPGICHGCYLVKNKGPYAGE